ncbi:hypothetical protein CALCODRAFT_485966 [Calocera cornea HHB12733]|uniref:Uncharacterized protein n=1 Tax=Calocera cornea HHB12733 TaxID=1353952 RepID=A0A165E2C4_9BASI|nr:hypothetical protein CALCODRAFT_485966 [Calocera cornea HHB12733]
MAKTTHHRKNNQGYGSNAPKFPSVPGRQSYSLPKPTGAATAAVAAVAATGRRSETASQAKTGRKATKSHANIPAVEDRVSMDNTEHGSTPAGIAPPLAENARKGKLTVSERQQRQQRHSRHSSF